MQGSPHRDRLIRELGEIRSELLAEARGLKPDELDWAPAEDMKSFRALLHEIGAMEKCCTHLLVHGEDIGWQNAWGSVSPEGASLESILDGLTRVREETLGYLKPSTEEQLETPIPMPASWHQYMGPEVEPEELIRWIARHEYYHLGQIITYRWMRGDNPYKRE